MTYKPCDPPLDSLAFAFILLHSPEPFPFFTSARWLYSNQIRALPAEFGRLTNLKKLWLDHNLLQELPPELSRLSNLQVGLSYIQAIGRRMGD